MSGQGFLAPEPPAVCEMCKKLDELRPYGPNGERVCFECGMKDPQAADRGFALYVLAKARRTKQ